MPRPQKGLILETSSLQAHLLLTRGDTLLLHKALHGGPALSKELGGVIQRCLRESCFHPDYIAVGVGPGSYTGVRVGAAMAQALAFGWTLPIRVFCSLSAFQPAEEENLAVLLDAGLGNLYCLQGPGPVFQMKLSDFPGLLPSRLVSPDPGRILQRLSQPLVIEQATFNASRVIAFCTKHASDRLAGDRLPLIY